MKELLYSTSQQTFARLQFNQGKPSKGCPPKAPMKLALLAALALGAARQAAAAAWNETVITQYGIVQGETSNDVSCL